MIKRNGLGLRIYRWVQFEHGNCPEDVPDEGYLRQAERITYAKVCNGEMVWFPGILTSVIILVSTSFPSRIKGRRTWNGRKKLCFTIPWLCLLLAFSIGPGSFEWLLNRYLVCTALLWASPHCGARSGPEGSKKSRRLKQKQVREWDDHCFRKELSGEKMTMFDHQSRKYVGERRKGNKVLESFSTRQRG